MFACTRVFTREMDRLGPGRHESEAKVHTSFQPSAGPCTNLQGVLIWRRRPITEKILILNIVE